MMNNKVELMNKLIEGVNRKGYLFARISVDEIEIPFMNFIARIRVTDYDKYTVYIFDNDNVLVEFRTYIKVGFAIRYVMMFRDNIKKKEIEEILNK